MVRCTNTRSGFSSPDAIRCLSRRKRKRQHHICSHDNASLGTDPESIETTVRQQRTEFASFVAHVGEELTPSHLSANVVSASTGVVASTNTIVCSTLMNALEYVRQDKPPVFLCVTPGNLTLPAPPPHRAPTDDDEEVTDTYTSVSFSGSGEDRRSRVACTTTVGSISVVVTPQYGFDHLIYVCPLNHRICKISRNA